MNRELTRFAAIGALAFLVDTAVLYAALRIPGVGLYTGRLISWTAAATFTWALNRRFTFAGARTEPPLAQWLRYLGANAVGGVANYATYALLVSAVPLFARYPVLAVGAGSVAGLLLNFTLSRRFVFRRR
jgi:putative flippase GtrA